MVQCTYNTNNVLTVAHWKNLKSVGRASFVIHNSFAIAVFGLFRNIFKINIVYYTRNII